MNHALTTPLQGTLALTDSFHRDAPLQQDKSLYKFIWVQDGTLTLEIDHVETPLARDEIVSLTPLHHVVVRESTGRYLTLLFNSEFYCIYGHDNEVSCNGLLFNGSAEIARLHLSPEQSALLGEITAKLAGEYAIRDNLQEEMLRILLKRFIISCTRMARERYSLTPETEGGFDIIRQFHVLVDRHFKEKRQVQQYADLLNRSPKTLSNLFAAYGFPSPLRIIHQRVLAEAKRLLLYTSRSAKETAALLGFEDAAAFSRFFKKMTGESIARFRRTARRE